MAGAVIGMLLKLTTFILPGEIISTLNNPLRHLWNGRVRIIILSRMTDADTGIFLNRQCYRTGDSIFVSFTEQCEARQINKDSKCYDILEYAQFQTQYKETLQLESNVFAASILKKSFHIGTMHDFPIYF